MHIHELNKEEMERVRKVLEEKLREEIIAYIEECGEEVDEEFVKQEVQRVTDASLEKEVGFDDWDSIDYWYDDVYREFINDYGTVYTLYDIDKDCDS